MTVNSITSPGQDNRPEPEPLLTAREVSALLRVDKKTVTRWALTGQLGFIKTPGGHFRFRAAEVHAIMNGQPS